MHTGLTVLPEVAWGSHLCHFYRNPDELLEVLVAFYRAGLEAHDKCLWITAPPCTATMARAGLGAAVAELDGFEQSGQLEIIDYRDWYLRGGELSADQIVGGWLDREDKALAAGFDGLRLSGNPNWLDGKSWDAFAEYEGRVHQAFHGRRIVAMCSYVVGQCGSDGIVDVLRNHKFALVRRGTRMDVARSATAVLSAVEERAVEPAAADGHIVQFYSAELPAATVARFLADGLEANHAAIVVATAEHRRAITSALGRIDHDAAALIARRQLLFVDAEEMLNLLCDAGVPRLELLHRHLAPILIELRQRFDGVCAFGEMVNLLAAGGRIEQACALEEHWNALLREYPARLLCGYDLASFDGDLDSGRFRAACHTHAAVHAPDESNDQSNDQSHDGELAGDAARDQARLVAELQHKTRVIRAATQQLAQLHQATAALSEAVSTREVARVIGRDVRSVAGAQSLTCALLDESGARLNVIDHHAAGDEQLAQLDNVAADAPLPLLAPLRNGSPSLEARAGGCDVSLALTVPGRRLGLLVFGFSPARELTSELRALLEDLARQSSIALDRARVYEEATRARGRAEEASRTKDEFLAMLGHELRNPLSPIVTALALMKLRGHVESSKEQDIIERQVQHLIRLVDDLLDVARVARGKIEIKRQPLELRAVLDNAVEIAGALFEQRRHKLRVELPPRGLRVLGDETRLAQVFGNLLTNAARYTPPGGRVTLAVGVDDGEVVVRVADNGVGIERELLDRVFDLFVQGKRASDRGEGGLGLGLALVRSLVELHGGRVEAHSDGPGQGSEFRVRLPVIDCEPANDAPSSSRSDHTSAESKSVLVVDDNVDGAELLAEMLRLAGHSVEVAHDGPSALALIQRCRFDVAILDIGLPEMDGYELATNIKKHHGAGAPRLIALTGYGQSSDRKRSAEVGFDEHMVKPLDPEKIYRAVDAAPAH